MNITPEILEREKQIDKLIKSIKKMDPFNELQSPMSQYICIKITGYLESSIKTIVLGFVYKKTESVEIRNVASSYIGTFHQAKYESINRILKSFDEKLDKKLLNELGNIGQQEKIKDLISSLYKQRDTIAHGGNVNVDLSVTKLNAYFDATKNLIRAVARTL